MKKWVGVCVLFAASLKLAASQPQIIYDYVIVGNGTAGSVLARKLSDDGKSKVLVLEAGVNHDNDPTVLFAQSTNFWFDWLLGLTTLTHNPKYSVNYSIPIFNTPLAHVDYSEGRGWGGGSMHNYQQVVRATPGIYNRWATLSGNSMWSYNNLLPLMIALENYTSAPLNTGNPAQRGSGGPISITQFPSANDPADTFAQHFASTTNAGFVVDYNDPTNISTTSVANVGFSAFQMFATPGPTVGTTLERSFSSRSFLDPVVTAAGKGKRGRLLRIESNAFVNRVLFNGKTAVGVEFVYGNEPNQVMQAFGKRVILCAGAINSPAILQRSGIGDATLLQSLGIEVIVDNPNVGANLVNQYATSAIVTGASLAQPFLQGYVNGSTTGAYTTPYSSTDPTRRLQIDALSIGSGLSQIISVILDPHSRGSVNIVSTNPLVAPSIDLNMYSDGAVGTTGTDANLAVSSYKLINNAVTANGGAVIYPPDFSSDAALLVAAKGAQGLLVVSHISGTTQMAQSMATGVVDGRLHVFGTKNLMVVDLGSVPQNPDGNPCYCVYILALGAAQILGAGTPPAL